MKKSKTSSNGHVPKNSPPWRIDFRRRRCEKVVAMGVVLNLFFILFTNTQPITSTKHELQLPNAVGNLEPHILSSKSVHESRIENIITSDNNNNNKEEYVPPLVFDMMSIGSFSRIDFQETQRRTFGSHKSIRLFFNITEWDDFDPDCADALQPAGAVKVANFCRRRRQWNNKTQYLMVHWQTLYASKRWLKTKKSPHGWVCAQNRPVMGLAKVIETYRTMSRSSLNSSNNKSSSRISDLQAVWNVLPDYLIVMDDDTYMNMDLVQEYLMTVWRSKNTQQNHKNANQNAPNQDSATAASSSSSSVPSSSHVIAGCMVRAPIERINITYPYGGYGVFVSKEAIFNYMRPIDCSKDDKQASPLVTGQAVSVNENDADFVMGACQQLEQNIIKERPLFRNGMTISDLQVAYVKDQPFTIVKRWNQGQCLHSDWFWGYFVNYYNIAQHTDDITYANVRHARLEAYQGSELGIGICNNHGSDCDATSHICHYSDSTRMEQLTAYAKEQNPDRYNHVL